MSRDIQADLAHQVARSSRIAASQALAYVRERLGR